MDGMYRTFVGDELILLNGDSVKVSVNEPKTDSKIENKTLDNDYEHITFQYCTEFFITHLKRETTESDVDKFRDYLMTIGDCVLVIGDLDLVKTHVHTNNPELALKAALKYGELDGVKIENMAEQNRKIRGVAEDSKKEELKDFAMVSICSGEGMTNIFRDLLVDQTIEGGQTMNPSVYDILGAINNAKAKNVFVLPNNSNIILAANQAKELADTNVYVLPTTCMPEGIAAALVFSENVSADENFENMKNAANGVMSAEVTHAVRSTRMNGFTVKDGDIIGIYNKKIVAKSQSIAEATMMTVSKIVAKAEMLTLYYGENVTAEDANLMVERLT
ncbi:MAG: DAK2 domain-containing protein, partial [Clostridia bacterium]